MGTVETVFRVGGDNYTKDDLKKMESVCLRALFRERVHHGIEISLYPIILGEKEVPTNYGLEAKLILDIWKERGLADEGPDFEWGKQHIELARRLREGQKVQLDEVPTEPFTPEELATVDKLLWERCSVRNWLEKEVPDEMVEKILEAGRAAPAGCNLGIVRFVVLKTPEEIKTIASDIPTPPGRCVIIVIGYDNRIYPTVGHDKLVPQNEILDCGAAGDHMLLMAHALGLGGVWLSKTDKSAASFKKKSGVPDYFEPVLHIAVGWSETGSIKSKRMPLSEMMVKTNLKN